MIRARKPITSNPENKVPFKQDQLPSKKAVGHVLREILSKLINPANMPSRFMILPPQVEIDNNDPLKLRYQNSEHIYLTPDDMRTDAGPRARAIENLCAALNKGCYRAMCLQPPLLFRNQATTTFYNEFQPSTPTGELAYLSTSNEPVYIAYNDSTTHVQMNIRGEAGIFQIPADHRIDCLCPLLTNNNNLSPLDMARLCLPDYLVRKYENNPDIPPVYSMTNAGKRYKNASNVYFSLLSEAGTVLPTLIRRQPFGIIARLKPVEYHPQFASIILSPSNKLTRAVATQIWRPDFQCYTQRMNETSGLATTSDDQPRFLPMKTYANNMDVTSYGPDIISLEDIIDNSVKTQVFAGTQSCSYCEQLLFVKSPTDILQHFMNNHTDLLRCNFTCPSCIGVIALSKESFLEHFENVHANTLSLMIVLNETCLHSRLQHGLILSLFLRTAIAAGMTSSNKDETHYVSAIGGYTTNSAAQLEKQVKEQQHLLLASTQKMLKNSVNPARQQTVKLDKETHHRSNNYYRDYPELPSRDREINDSNYMSRAPTKKPEKPIISSRSYKPFVDKSDSEESDDLRSIHRSDQHKKENIHFRRYTANSPTDWNDIIEIDGTPDTLEEVWHNVNNSRRSKNPAVPQPARTPPPNKRTTTTNQQPNFINHHNRFTVEPTTINSQDNQNIDRDLNTPSPIQY